MNKFSVNLMPSPALLSAAYKALVHSYGWRSFTLLYQDNHGLMRLQEIHIPVNKTSLNCGTYPVIFKRPLSTVP